MADLIDRQAAIDAVQEELNKQERSRLVNIWTTAEVRFVVVELILKMLPTADAVEVTRCKDCEYWRGEGKYCDYDMSGLADDYCSWGERRKADGDGK